MHIYLELPCEWVPSTLLPLAMALFTDNGLGPLTFLRWACRLSQPDVCGVCHLASLPSTCAPLVDCMSKRVQTPTSKAGANAHVEALIGKRFMLIPRRSGCKRPRRSGCKRPRRSGGKHPRRKRAWQTLHADPTSKRVLFVFTLIPRDVSAWKQRRGKACACMRDTAPPHSLHIRSSAYVSPSCFNVITIVYNGARVPGLNPAWVPPCAIHGTNQRGQGLYFAHMIAGDYASPSRFSHVSMLHASLGSIQRGSPSLGDPWDRRIVFRVKTKQKTAQTRPGPAEAIPPPCALSPAQGCASVLLASNSWLSCGRTGLCRRRGPQSPTSQALSTDDV